MTSEYGSQHKPVEIRLKREEHALEVDFDDGTTFHLPAEYLRIESPSAEVQGHDPRQKQTLGGKQFVNIIGVEPVGTYAVRLKFDDLHDTGLYTWDWLYYLGANYETLWQSYLDNLESKGLKRAPK